MMNPFMRRPDRYRLVVSMTGVQMGDRLAQIGCADGMRFAAIAAKVGLSGEAVVIVPDNEAAARAQKGAEETGVLIDVKVAPPTRLPIDGGAFDVAVIDNTGDFVGTMRAQDRVAMFREMFRVLRPGGRAIVIGTAPRGGLGALLTRTRSGPGFDATPSLKAEGFRSVRELAERDGLRFVEGMKSREVG